MDGPSRNRICRCAAVIVLSSLATSRAEGQVIPANATVVVPVNPPANNVQHLGIGDWYEITVGRGDINRQYCGTLVKATDRWIVLFDHAEVRTEYGVPVLSKVLYFNRMFRSVGIATSNYLWLPREAATIRGRRLAIQKSPLPTPKGNLPQRGDDYAEVEFIDEGQNSILWGDVTLDESRLVARFQDSVAVEKPMPVLGRIPVVGGAFKTESHELREQTREIALNNVLCIKDPSAYRDDHEREKSTR